MTYKTTVMAALPGFVPPQEAVEKLLDEHKSMIGFASALTVENPGEEDQQVLEIIIESEEMPPIAEVMKQLESYKGDLCLLTFGDFPKEWDGESEQPFVILRADPTDEDSDPVLIACIDGSFPAHSTDGADGAAVIADILRGTLGRFLTTAENMTELVESIQTDPAIPRLIKGLYKDRASITLLAENGAIWTWGENPQRAEFDWGWMSQSHGYGQKSVVQKATDAVRTFGSGRRGKGSTKTETSAGSLQPATQEQTAVHASSGKTGDAGDAAYIMVAAPKDWTKDEKRTFYKQLNNGLVPQGYKDSPQIKILRTVWDKYSKANAAKLKVIADVEPVEPVTSGKVEVIPKASPAELKLHKDVFMKRPTLVKITNEGRGIIDPKRSQEMEKEYATYPELAGLKSLLDVFAYSNEDILDLIQKTPTIAMILMGNLISYSIEHTPEEELNPPAEEPEVIPEPLKKTGTDGVKKPGGARTFGGKKK